MEKTRILAALFCAAVFARGADEAGNLLNNPEFRLDASGRVVDWDPHLELRPDSVRWDADGGAAFTATNGAAFLRQYDLKLVPGAKYRIGGWVKTRGFSFKGGGLIVYNWAWTASAGARKIPADTNGEWVRVEETVTCPDSRNEIFVFTAYFSGFKGEFALRSPWIVPADDAAKAGSERAPRVDDLGDAPCRRVKVLPTAKCSHKPERKLNRQVTRLVTAEAKNGEIGFSAPRDGWIWISLEKGGESTLVFLDGAPVVWHRPGERFETMRRVDSGDHALRVAGAVGGGLVVNSIPQIFAYAYPRTFKSGQYVIQPLYRPFGGAFRFDHLYGAINTFNYGYASGTIPKADLADFRARGLELVALCGPWNHYVRGYTNHLEAADHAARRFMSLPGQIGANLDGTAYDEIPMDTVKEKMRYAQTMRLMRDAPRIHYTWSSGTKFSTRRIDAEYLSACLDVSGGRGRFLFECYPSPPATEAETEAYLDGFLNEPIRRAKKLVPGSEKGSLIVMGMYNRFCSNTYNAHCQIDPKRFYDLYLHRLATDPEFDGLAGTGLYAYEHGSEEDVRWVTRLFRHYMLEGNVERLSDRYGYVYEPGHVADGAFARGLAAWRAKPAAEKGIEARTVVDWGRKAMLVRRAPQLCDTVCAFRRAAKGRNELSQTLKGLAPGKLYSLRYAVGAASAFAALHGKAKDAPKPAAPRRFAFSAELANADVVGEGLPLMKYDDAEINTTTANYRTVVFRARGETAELTFTDGEAAPDAPAGEELLLGVVTVAPYYLP